MKNDPTFKFLAAVIVAGVIVAFASPSPSTLDESHQATAVVEMSPAQPVATE